VAGSEEGGELLWLGSGTVVVVGRGDIAEV